ncbi:hypothetical protein P167DRAFT_536136 [Morchella conica CCBAS932]|uniref:Uncharacterized protein n=1 Tax=Morchella conica CCBAS932 TaxID=1392247 RepID=A0A3N4KSK7_9PEZI|nr:hypothetical protein P167DRAFT_536136 [Morchella conica CCBAS932]
MEHSTLIHKGPSPLPLSAITTCSFLARYMRVRPYGGWGIVARIHISVLGAFDTAWMS